MDEYEEKFRRIFKKGLETNGVSESQLSPLILEKYKKFIDFSLRGNPTAIEYLHNSMAHQTLAHLLKRPNTEAPGAKGERN